MSNFLNDHAEVPLSCPKCGNGFTKTVGELKSDTKFKCSTCGVDFDSAEFKAGIEKAEKSVADLARKLGRFGK